MNAARILTNGMSKLSLAMLAVMTLNGIALAGEATTSATATSNLFRPGTASATAGFVGGNGQGYARTDTRSGKINFAQGVALGVDQHGISFSASNALASRLGPALASTFSLTIGRDGSVASSGGLSTAVGGLTRTVSAGSFAGSNFGGSQAGATAGGRSDPHGFAQGRTWSRSSPPRLWRR